MATTTKAGNVLVRGLRPMRPGELLREDVLPALGKSKVEIARLLGVSHQALDDIRKAADHPCDGAAHRQLCGNGPELWINMQCAFDLDAAEQELASEIEKIPTLTADERIALTTEQIEDLKLGIVQLDMGEFASDEEVAKMWEKFTR
jgi:addiction module HigA family antidote